MTKAEVLKQIRLFCVQCCGDQAYMVTDCPSKPGTTYECALWEFRMGKDPKPNPNKSAAGKIRARENFGHDSTLQNEAKNE